MTYSQPRGIPGFLPWMGSARFLVIIATFVYVYATMPINMAVLLHRPRESAKAAAKKRA